MSRTADDSKEQHETVGAWAKRYHLANRALIESVLRPYDLGSTQWYVLYQLAHDGPTRQRDLGQMLHVERATMSGIVSTLVRKGLVTQIADSHDQRRRVLELTQSGLQLWGELPDPIAAIHKVSLAGISPADIETTIRVLRAATANVDSRTSRDVRPGDS